MLYLNFKVSWNINILIAISRCLPVCTVTRALAHTRTHANTLCIGICARVLTGYKRNSLVSIRGYNRSRLTAAAMHKVGPNVSVKPSLFMRASSAISILALFSSSSLARSRGVIKRRAILIPPQSRPRNESPAICGAWRPRESIGFGSCVRHTLKIHRRYRGDWVDSNFEGRWARVANCIAANYTVDPAAIGDGGGVGRTRLRKRGNGAQPAKRLRADYNARPKQIAETRYGLIKHRIIVIPL